MTPTAYQQRTSAIGAAIRNGENLRPDATTAQIQAAADTITAAIAASDAAIAEVEASAAAQAAAAGAAASSALSAASKAGKNQIDKANAAAKDFQRRGVFSK